MLKNVWVVILLVIIIIIGSYYLSQFWIPLGFIGLIVAIAIVVNYIYQKYASTK